MGLKKKEFGWFVRGSSFIFQLYFIYFIEKTLYDYWSLLGSFSYDDATLTTNVLMKSVLDDLRVYIQYYVDAGDVMCYVHVVKSTRLTVGQCSIFCILKAAAFLS